MNELMAPALLMLGVILGAVIVGLLAQGKRRAEVDSAVARAAIELQGELSELRERVRAGDEARRSDSAKAEALRQQADTWRSEGDLARDEIARLSERVRRMSELEAELAESAKKLGDGTELVRRLSSELAEKAQAVTSLTEQCRNSEGDRDGLHRQLTAASAALNSANERKAALEQQVQGLQTVERDLAVASAEVERVTAQLNALRESNSVEVARHEAEKEAHARVRAEFAEARLALTTSADEVGRLTAQLAELREASGADIARLNAELAATREAHGLVVNELDVVSKAHSDVILEATTLSRELTELKTRVEAERSSAQEKLLLLQQAKEALGDQFKSLANDILEEKSRRFAEQNQASLGQLLAPLKTQLTEFKGKVEEVYVQEGKDRTALSEQVRQLVNLNQALSQDAQNLTRALKGDVKMQGNWGELVLERVLESAGLVRGREYEVQESQKREDGTRGQADVVIRLPEERHLVVDSKVSLLAYESYVAAETDEERAVSVRRHLESVRNHIKGLSGKQYQSMYGIKQLDFVLLFVPIEPAFMLAITNDAQLFMHAWEKNVLLVSPSTLLFVVRTVAHLWRQEAQTRNAQDIARRGADLYDKLSDFVKDLTGVGERLKQAQDAYDAAHKRLATGRGNVIRQAEMLRTLGVKPTKSLPVAMVEQAADDELRGLGEIVALARANTPTEGGNVPGAPVLGGS
jgi:DNA recombination protein RmuC